MKVALIYILNISDHYNICDTITIGKLNKNNRKETENNIYLLDFKVKLFATGVIFRLNFFNES